MIGLDAISVIVPTANERHNVRRFLGSIPRDVEVVVVDRSVDGTAELVLELRPWRTVVIRSNASIAEARAIGAARASGELFVFSDADVRFGVGYFRTLARRPPAEAFFGPKRATEAHPVYDLVFLNGQKLLWSMGVPAATGSNMGLRRAAFDRTGGFRLDLPTSEDTELAFRAKGIGLRVEWRPECAVFSLDDRRLERGAWRKLLHSTARASLLLLDRAVPVPADWLRSDWGYWRTAPPRPSIPEE